MADSNEWPAILSNLHTLVFLGLWLFATKFKSRHYDEVEALQPFEELAHVVVLSSFMVNVVLQLTPLVSLDGCAENTATVKFLIGLYETALHFRVWQVFLGQYQAHRTRSTKWEASTSGAVPIPSIARWRRVLENPWTWSVGLNIVIWIVLAVTSVQTPGHVAASCLVQADVTCRLDIGNGAAIFMFVFSLASHGAAILALRWVCAPDYMLVENAVMMGLQVVFLLPGIVFYADAHARCVADNLDIVRILLILYNVFSIILIWLPIFWLRARIWWNIGWDTFYYVMGRCHGRQLLPTSDASAPADIALDTLRSWPLVPARFDTDGFFKSVATLAYWQPRLSKPAQDAGRALTQLAVDHYGDHAAVAHGQISDTMLTLLGTMGLQKDQFASAGAFANYLLTHINDGAGAAAAGSAAVGGIALSQAQTLHRVEKEWQEDQQEEEAGAGGRFDGRGSGGFAAGDQL